jgi:hypothetical protein
MYWIEMDRMNKIEKMDRNGPKWQNGQKNWLHT